MPEAEVKEEVKKEEVKKEERRSISIHRDPM